jgi:hypothetical protein
VGKTSTAFGTAGIELNQNGVAGKSFFTRSGGDPISLNRLSSDGAILTFYKDTTIVGTIASDSGSMLLGSGDVGVYFDAGSDRILPMNMSTLGVRNDAIDIGGNPHRFKDLYLSGNIYLGGTGASNALDDYEEGTYVPTITSATGTITTASATGIYTKVGRLVTVGINILITTNGTGAGNVIATLPFTVGSFTYYAHGRETVVSGFALTGTVSGTTVVLVKTSNDLYPGGDSHRLQASFTYSV